MDPVEDLFGLNPKSYEEALDLVLNSIRTIILQRHEEYGHKNLTKRGHLGLIVRTEDKLARVEENSDHSKRNSNDTIVKAWGDTIGYAAQAILYELGWIGLPTSETPKELTDDEIKKATLKIIQEIQPDAEFPWTPFVPQIKPLPYIPPATTDPWAGYPYGPTITYGNQGTHGDDGLSGPIFMTEVYDGPR